MHNRVRAMMEGALISGIFLILMFLTVYTPLGLISIVALPVPFTVYAARNDLKKSIAVVVVSCLLTVFIGALPSIFSALFAGLVGVVMGTLYRRRKSASAVFLGGALASLVFFLLSIVVSYYILGINPIKSMQDMIRQSFEMSRSLMQIIGQVDKKQLDIINNMVSMIARLVPLLLIVASAQFAILNHWLSRRVLKRLGVETRAFPPFRELRWPRSVLFYYLLSLVLSVTAGSVNQLGVYHVLLLNIQPIFELMMVIQGLSFVFFYSHLKKWGRGVPIIAVVLMFIFPLFPFILVLLGILDLGFDLKKRSLGKS